ncbi:hypothetical protein MKW98_018504 [Papaver atlanticum]|uniref:DUF668 domain-containing protein n=1 Tax=Papaver atlanticum TaxID=357466 RepID=A0AAD4XVU4_9MAGN|nr:hypothetical protein MKW98_018504 [Papaver atlanticum]
MISKSGPILKPISKHGLVRFWSRESKPARDENIGFGMGFKENPYIGFSVIEKPSSGLAMRYANVIILMERYLNSPSSISEYARKDLYQMLPDNLQWDDDSVAQGIRDGMSVILGWLAPMAHTTVKWHTERNFEKQNFDKAKAAIVEVLVGLSCICRYELMCQYSV